MSGQVEILPTGGLMQAEDIEGLGFKPDTYVEGLWHLRAQRGGGLSLRLSRGRASLVIHIGGLMFEAEASNIDSLRALVARFG
jgi:hypothetical protein